jgi:hypothetical protein
MPIIEDKELYEKVKKYADSVYAKPSAYKSGFIVKKYKEMGGTYKDDKQPKKLKQWFNEEWGSIGKEGEYPTYRPFKRINESTPLTKDEIDPKQAKKQIELKQKIKGEFNLPPFKKKGKGIDNTKDLQEIPNIDKSNAIWKWSNPIQVRKMANKYLGKDVPIYLSNKKDKKYMVENPEGKFISFGQLGFEDFTQHKNLERRKRYLTRTANMRGNWKDSKYSANNLSRNILW